MALDATCRHPHPSRSLKQADEQKYRPMHYRILLLVPCWCCCCTMLQCCVLLQACRSLAVLRLHLRHQPVHFTGMTA